MIRSIIGSSLRFRLLIIGVALGVMAVGIAQLRAAPVDALPEFTPPYVEVQTEALGLSADEVESLITVPLEVNLLNGIQGVDVIRSESVAGLSSIVLVFEPGTDLYQARQLVQERLIEAHALPNVSKPPTMIQPLSSSSRVMMIGLDPKELSPIEASVISRWVIKPRLMGVPGVANVAIWGMRHQQLQVQVDPERLRDLSLTLHDLVETTGNAQVVSPLSFLEASTPGSGGFVETPQQRLQVRHVLERLADPAELGREPVDDTAGRLRLRDVADIKVDHQPLIVVALALAAFLFQWRTIAIALVTIPVSLLTAALVLDALGETFNAVSFAGLAAALALVIDDAVVGAGSAARRVPHDEVRSPLVYATLIALLAIAPIAVMEGRPGAFFEPFALAYALAVAAAMMVATTLTPALSALLFSRGAPGGRGSPLVAWLRPRYERALTRFTRSPRTPLAAAGVCAVVGLAVLPLLGASLVPAFKDRDVLVRLDAEPGTSHPRMTEIATAVSRELRSLPGVHNVGADIGRAVTGDQLVDVNSSQVWVSLAADSAYDDTVDAIEAAVRRVPGVEHEVASYSAHRIREVGGLREDEGHEVGGSGLDVLTGSDEPLVVRVYGHDLAVLRRQADRVRQLVSGVDGVVDPRIEVPPDQPNLEIEVDLARARRAGIKPGDVRRAAATLVQGIQVGSVFDEQKVFDVIVLGVPETRRSV